MSKEESRYYINRRVLLTHVYTASRKAHAVGPLHAFIYMASFPLYARLGVVHQKCVRRKLSTLTLHTVNAEFLCTFVMYVCINGHVGMYIDG